MTESDIVTTAVNAYTQVGVVGAIIIYCLYTDWITRRDTRANNILRSEADKVRDALSAQREKECIERVMALEARQAGELLSVIDNNTEAVDKLLLIMNSKRIHVTPAPEEETVILRKAR